uniref:non-specific serine/threonine protein kinase n=1 Tax=Ananas comosus var. bracteatus TaxID=296719 RepID=A0A6V7PFW3_ANACO|nr:unnamed protein product [Ananas comosus var. bracteatus]
MASASSSSASSVASLSLLCRRHSLSRHPLADGNSTLVSASGVFELGFFSPGNSRNRYLGLWYKNIGVQTIVWVANREDPIADRTGLLKIGGGDGNLILSNQSSYVFWSTNTSSAGGGAAKPVAQLLDSGNFVLKADAGDSDGYGFLWQSFDYPTDTLLPGMKLGWDFRRGLDRALTTWKSPDDPSAGTTLSKWTLTDRRRCSYGIGRR